MNREIIISFYIFKEFFLFQNKNKEETKKNENYITDAKQKNFIPSAFCYAFLFFKSTFAKGKCKQRKQIQMK